MHLLVSMKDYFLTPFFSSSTWMDEMKRSHQSLFTAPFSSRWEAAANFAATKPLNFLFLFRELPFINCLHAFSGPKLQRKGLQITVTYFKKPWKGMSITLAKNNFFFSFALWLKLSSYQRILCCLLFRAQQIKFFRLSPPSSSSTLAVLLFW